MSELVPVVTGVVLPAAVQERLDEAARLYDARAAHLATYDPDARRDPRAARYHRQAKAESTRRAYLRWIGMWIDWCARENRRERPAHAMTLEAWAIHLCTVEVQRGRHKGVRGLSPASIRQSISAVRTYHRLAGSEPPDAYLASDVVLGHEFDRKTDPRVHDGREAAALRLPALIEIFEICDPIKNQGARDRALLSLGWTMMARRHELAQLDVGLGDVKLVDDGVRIRVRSTKTNRLKGREIRIGWKPELGEICPVVCITRWNERLEEHGITSGGWLRSVDQHDTVNKGDGEGFAGKPALYIDPVTVELVVARLAMAARVSDATEMSGHSLRRGGAEDLYASGVDILRIARMGGWNERSPVIFRYIKDVADYDTNALAVADFTKILAKGRR